MLKHVQCHGAIPWDMIPWDVIDRQSSTFEHCRLALSYSDEFVALTALKPSVSFVVLSILTRQSSPLASTCDSRLHLCSVPQVTHNRLHAADSCVPDVKHRHVIAAAVQQLLDQVPAQEACRKGDWGQCSRDC